ncbi:hypothetical protein G7Y89_g9932 [Cudoniella acicularis]|uniref:Uncharacterized protein n=1 Tax=Cudoniella acicularis TaxID=354080 RepID=A0A8H4RGF8_9HELO|nr:hypothetical protein G7Y89_g9932 [Cudoniella acicularis]
MSAAMAQEAMGFQENGTVNDTGCTERSINNSVVVLSTAQSINSQFIDKTRFGYRKIPGARVSVNTACLPGNPYILALSAKPLEKGPEDLLALTDAMESRRPSNKTEDLLAHLTSKAIEDTGKIWSHEVHNNRRDTAEIREVIDETTKMADKDSRAIWRINEDRKQKHLKSGHRVQTKQNPTRIHDQRDEFCATELNIRRSRISYIPPGSSKKLREAEILKFQTQPGDVGRAGWSEDGCTRILIAPILVIAHGINLPLTKFITILEPDYLRRNQEEFIGQAIRAQNGNDEVFARVISTRNGNTEGAIITRHEVRGQINEALESRSDRPLQGRKRDTESEIEKEPGSRPSKSQRVASRSSKTAVVDEDKAAADAYEPMDLDFEGEKDLIDEYGYGRRAPSDNSRVESEERGDVKREAVCTMLRETGRWEVQLGGPALRNVTHVPEKR